MSLQNLKTQLESAFAPCLQNACIQLIQETSFDILDSQDEDKKQEPSKLVAASEGQLNVQNPTNKEIAFWAIDKCTFIDGGDVSRCDLALFDSTTFCLAEIKDSKFKQRQTARKKAIEQLENTIQLLDNEVIDLKNFAKKALVVFPASVPKLRISEQLAKLRFEELNYELLEGNQLNF